MAQAGQLGDEVAADRAARADHKDAHNCFPPCRSPSRAGGHAGRLGRVTVTDTGGGGNVTSGQDDRPGGSSGGRPGGEQGGEGHGRAEDWLAERFEEHRGRLRAVAYRVLGSLEEADHAVEESWVRFSAAGADQVLNLGGWLTTIVTRACLNTLRARAARPETLAGAQVPDPVLSPATGPTPEQEALLADSVGLALLVVLDTLGPAERVAFVLHDVFDVPFGEIAPVLGRSTEAARQLASRARHRVKASGPHAPDGTIGAQRAVIDAFFA